MVRTFCHVVLAKRDYRVKSVHSNSLCGSRVKNYERGEILVKIPASKINLDYFKGKFLLLKRQMNLQENQVTQVFVRSEHQFGCVPWKVKWLNKCISTCS